MIDATELEGYTAEAPWSDLKFDSAHREQIGPMAALTDGGWKEWVAKLSKPFFEELVLHFAERLTEAKEWVRAQSRR